jgi:hypothetical protein
MPEKWLFPNVAAEILFRIEESPPPPTLFMFTVDIQLVPEYNIRGGHLCKRLHNANSFVIFLNKDL